MHKSSTPSRKTSSTSLLPSLYSVRSGYIHANNGRLWFASIFGYAWSRACIISDSQRFSHAQRLSSWIRYYRYRSFGRPRSPLDRSPPPLSIPYLLRPLYFVRSGLLRPGLGYVWSIGIRGFYWPATTGSNIWGQAGLGTYYFAFNANNVLTTDGPNDRWDSYPLRA